MISEKDAKRLAAAYHGYLEAYPKRREDPNAIHAWGKALKGVQEKTGVELVDFTQSWAARYLPE